MFPTAWKKGRELPEKGHFCNAAKQVKRAFTTCRHLPKGQIMDFAKLPRIYIFLVFFSIYFVEFCFFICLLNKNIEIKLLTSFVVHPLFYFLFLLPTPFYQAIEKLLSCSSIVEQVARKARLIWMFYYKTSVKLKNKHLGRRWFIWCNFQHFYKLQICSTVLPVLLLD